MKAEILKIAGVKSEKEFYKKYPTEEAFMKAHGKKFKKAAMGAKMVKTQLQQLTDFGNPPIAENGVDMNPAIGSYMGGEQVQNPQPIYMNDIYNTAFANVTGISPEEKQRQEQLQSLNKISGSVSESAKNWGNIIGTAAGMLSGGKGSSTAKKGKSVKKAQGGLDIWGNPLPLNVQQMQPSNNPNAGVGLGLNNAPGGTLNLAGNAQNAMLANQAMLWGTGGTVSTPDVLGGVTPSQFQGLNTEIVGKNSFLDILGGAKGLGNLASGVIGGIQDIKAAKKATADAKKMAKISDLTLQATNTRPEPMRRRYVTPWDNPTNPNERFPTYGVGTNYLSRNGSVVKAEGGMQVGGNLGEIQNTYAPNNLYDDLGYEPLNDSNQVKQYAHGGWTVPRAPGGGMFGILGGPSASTPNASGMTGADFGNLGTGIFNAAFGASPESNLGGTIGSVFGPVGTIAGTMLGKVLGSRREGEMKDAQRKTKSNIERAAMTSAGQALQSQYSSYVRNGGTIPGMEEGGWVSHDWQPQVIATFGEHKVSDLLRPDPTMDTLRTGGHIRQNNMFPTDQYALGGELKTTWGGYAEPISQNPYMPGTGETVMFRGKSHEESDGKGHTGIGVKYGDGGMTDYAEFGSQDADADVEVERGEPATEMVDGKTGEKNMVVYGNLKISKDAAAHIGDKNAEGRKYKGYVADLSKKEAKVNKKIDKASSEMNELKVYTPFDKLKFEALKATLLGGNMKLKDSAELKMNAAAVQNATNDTAEEYGIVADDLARGKIKIDKKAMKEKAKFGKEIFKAQGGGKFKIIGQQAGSLDYNPIGEAGDDELWGNKTVYENKWKPKVKEALSDPKRADEIINMLENYTGQDAQDVVKIIKAQKTRAGKIAKIQELGTDEKIGPYHNLLNTTIDRTVTPPVVETTPPMELKKIPDPVETPTPTFPVTAQKKNAWMPVVNSLLPLFDKPFTDYDVNLYPEMMALSMNTLEPVQAEGYRPDLDIPYDISLQDQLNANQADYNATQRAMGYNPAAKAALDAIKYAANSRVLGEQFRLNQAEKAGVYNKNREILNDAKLKNIGIFDTQMQRQEQAKSITKATALEAMQSMADKIDKNKLENRTLAVYENMFPNYRLRNNMRLSPTGLTSFNIPQVYIPQYGPDGKVIGYKIAPAGTTQGAVNQQVAATSPTLTPINQNTSNGVPFYLNPNSQPAVQTGPFGFTFPTGSTTPTESYSASQLPTYEDIYPEETVYPTQQKKGGITKKNNMNSSVVRAFKNL